MQTANCILRLRFAIKSQVINTREAAKKKLVAEHHHNIYIMIKMMIKIMINVQK